MAFAVGRTSKAISLSILLGWVGAVGAKRRKGIYGKFCQDLDGILRRVSEDTGFRIAT
jgi:hypothetical protein